MYSGVSHPRSPPQSPLSRTIFLARHGETEWNRERRWQGLSDIALNQTGRIQARELAEELRSHRIARVFASDLARARETGEIVADLLGLGAVGVDPRLRERSFGIFEGLTADECAVRFSEHWSAYTSNRQPPPGAELFEQVAARMRSAVERLARHPFEPDASLLVVSHGGAMRALVFAVCGEMPGPLENGATFRLKVGSTGLLSAERIQRNPEGTSPKRVTNS